MAALERIFTRALRGSGAGLGNAAPSTGYTAQGKSYGPTNPGAGSRNRKAPIAGTRSITYNSPGQPLPLDIAADQLSQEDYLGSVYVMRCVRLIAETLAASPFVAGPNPFDPGNYNLDAPLARLLGPATPQAPGGPNPHLTARAFWIWSVVQYITSGRWGWELQWDGQPAKSNIVGLWPLVSIALAPIPIDGKTEIWSGFQYQTPTGFVQLSTDRVCYAWRPAITDWRMPESVLQSARLPIYMQRAIDRYMVGLLKNNMVATTMVVAPPFDEADQRRSWEDQFLSEFTGIDRAGGTIFGYIEPDEDDPAGKPLVQVERIAQTPVEGSLATLSTTAKNDVCIALGTPRSLLGDASQRIYSNAGAENRNFWTITMINIIAEIQDHVNLRLAPRLEQGTVGWFDLSKVEALQPPSTFTPPDVAEAINAGILDAEQAALILGIPPPGDQGDVDVETTILGEEAEKSGAIGGRSDPVRLRLRQWGFRDDIDRSEWVQVKRTVSMNSYLWREPSKRVRPKVDLRPRIRAYSGVDHAEAIRQRTEGIRALATAKATTAKVHRALARSYPEDVLDWVDGADWSGPTRVPLSDIKMDRRPGGRDMQRVDGIAKAIADDPEGAAAAPVVLVKTPSGALKVADGYHRTLAHKRLGHKSVPAYVGEVDDDQGPWDKEMHDAKQNRSAAITARSRAISRDPKLLSSTFGSEPRGIPRGPRVVTRALDTWYGTGGSSQPMPPKTVDVSEILTEAHPYVVESEDNFNGVPNHVVEEIAEALTQAGGEDEDEQPIKGVASTLKSAAATTAY